MRWIQMVQTSDGVLHENALKAEQHSEKRYGDELTRIAHELCRTDGKYSKLTEYIDANLGAFVKLAALKADITLENSDDDDNE
jgi:hypothetical protein